MSRRSSIGSGEIVVRTWKLEEVVKFDRVVSEGFRSFFHETAGRDHDGTSTRFDLRRNSETS